MGELTVAEVLERAADLIEPEGAWIQNSAAVDRHGFQVPDGNYHSAVCWCIGGAINHVIRRPVSGTPAWEFLKAMIGDIPNWNDEEDRTQAEVVAKLREAAQLARTQDNGSL